MQQIYASVFPVFETLFIGTFRYDLFLFLGILFYGFNWVEMDQVEI